MVYSVGINYSDQITKIYDAPANQLPPPPTPQTNAREHHTTHLLNHDVVFTTTAQQICTGECITVYNTNIGHSFAGNRRELVWLEHYTNPASIPNDGWGFHVDGKSRYALNLKIGTQCLVRIMHWQLRCSPNRNNNRHLIWTKQYKSPQKQSKKRMKREKNNAILSEGTTNIHIYQTNVKLKMQTFSPGSSRMGYYYYCEPVYFYYILIL